MAHNNENSHGQDNYNIASLWLKLIFEINIVIFFLYYFYAYIFLIVF